MASKQGGTGGRINQMSIEVGNFITDEDGNYTIITWCEEEVINTLNCNTSTGNPGCGWDASVGYYNCVEASYVGTEDPSGENPCDCSELE